MCTEEHNCAEQDACGRGFNASVVCDADGCLADMYTCTCPYGISKLPAGDGKAVRCKGKSHFFYNIRTRVLYAVCWMSYYNTLVLIPFNPSYFIIVFPRRIEFRFA